MLSGKTPIRPLALVTGGSRRVGAEITRLLHQTHDLIVQTRMANNATATFVADLNTCRADSARWVAADLDAMEGVEAIAESIEHRLDVLVLNASRFEACGDTFDSAWVGQFERHMHTNVAMPVVLAHRLREPFATASASGGDPSIVWVLDTHRRGVFPRYSAYALSRAAGVAAVNTLAHAMAPNARVVGVAPGTVLANEQPVKAIKPDAQAEQRLTATAGTPRDVAQAVRFIVETPFVNATIIEVDGGRPSWPVSRD